MSLEENDIIPIELTPHDAVQIFHVLHGLHELHGDSLSEAIVNAFNNYCEQVKLNMTKEQYEDACAERGVNRILGRDYSSDNDG